MWKDARFHDKVLGRKGLLTVLDDDLVVPLLVGRTKLKQIEGRFIDPTQCSLATCNIVCTPVLKVIT